ncbi:hypothetical protein [Streptomyces sp. NPDC017993]|uniref:hypothetical protein n=1 Tax=Streptomyces sp. NPDC017993 TaxID=3365027 RepID=UPI0037B7A4F2
MVERSPRDPRDPLDEEAAWAEIVAGYGEEPRFPTDDDHEGPDQDGSRRDTSGQDDAAGARDESATVRPAGSSGPAGIPGVPGALDLTKAGTSTAGADATATEGAGSGDAAESSGGTDEKRPERGTPGGSAGDAVGSFVVYAPGVGPRDWDAARPSDDDFDESDEGHFTPPEPPPLPEADVTTKFAWLAVLGGPLLLVLMVLFQQPVTWWISVLGIGGFLGGFATLVARMKHDDEDDDGMTGGGAVV